MFSEHSEFMLEINKETVTRCPMYLEIKNYASK